MIVAIIQARMGSTRLPGKVLMPLGETEVLRYVVSRAEQIEGIDKVVVATTDQHEDDAIEAYCQDRGIHVHRGSELDVLDRYVRCAEEAEASFIIRITADCPYVDIEQAAKIVRAMRTSGDTDFYVTKDSERLPRGLNVEGVSMSALRRMHEEGHEERHREHVTYFGYEYKENFTFTYVEPDEGIISPELRITLDTDEDYALCKAVAEQFRGDLFVPAKQVVAFLNDHPEVAVINQHIEQKTVK